MGRLSPLIKRRAFLILLIAWLAVVMSASAASVPTFSLSGTTYVRLDDWAKPRNFKVQWTIPKEQVKLTSTWSTWIFNVDSRKCTLNGVNVWLSHPVALRSTSASVSFKDLATALQPIYSPPKSPAGKKVSLICLDPGHGGRDPGKQQRSEAEKKHTLLLAKEINSLLSKAGFKVLLTRSRDTYVELSERAAIAARKKADLFVSLHFNSADSSVRGAEVYCMTPAYASSTNARGEGAEHGSYPGNQFDSKNMLLAYQIQKAMTTKLGMEDRGVKRARLAVLRSAQMPAVLVEGGFMSNSSEARKIYDSIWRRELARAIVDGILAYKKIIES